jgi:CHAT domain-containing protein
LSESLVGGVIWRFVTDNRNSWRTPEPSGDPNAACWRAWAASADLEVQGERRLAQDWISIAAELLDHDDCRDERVLQAEVTGLAARFLYEDGDIGDALPHLVATGTVWAAVAKAVREPDALEGIAAEIRRMLAAFDPGRGMIPERGLAQSGWLVNGWEKDCLLESWSKLAATEGRALAAAGRYDAARQAVLQMKTWMQGRYYAPGYPTRREWYLQRIEEAVAAGTEETAFATWLGGLRRPATREETLAHLRKEVEAALGEDEEGFAGKRVELVAARPLWRLEMAEGDIDVAAGAREPSVQAFERAVRVWDSNAINYEDLHCVAQALFNQANSCLSLERYAEAREKYDKCFEYFGIADQESVMRARHGELVARWKLDPDTDIEAEARQLLIDWERFLEEKPDRRFLYRDKAAISPLYELMISLLARRGGVQAAIDYYDVLAALRQDQALAASALQPDSDEAGLLRELEVLSEFLADRPGYLVFFLQRGVGVLTYLAVRGGGDITDNLDGALLFGVMPAQLPAIVIDLLQAEQEDLEAIYSGQSLETGPASPELARLATQAWEALPDRLRDWLSAAQIIVYSPDASGNFDKVPFELFGPEQGWLGIDHAIVRHPSPATVMSLLTRIRPGPEGKRGWVVRAEDPVGFMPLPEADIEVAQVSRCFGLLGLESLAGTRPDVPALIEALDAGYRVIHYSGHGLAGGLGEGLPLAGGRPLQPGDLGDLSGLRTPFVFLSACDVGRTRYISGGKQSGLATGLVEKGAPAVVGCLHAVPDRVARLMAVTFYREARAHPVGEALCLARKRLADQGIQPACWAVYALYGDPAATISATAEVSAG